MVLYVLIAAITVYLACMVRTTEYERSIAVGAQSGRRENPEIVREEDPGRENNQATAREGRRLSDAAPMILEGYVTRRRALNALAIGAIFVILTSMAALRLEVGNDYGTYVVTCHEIFQRGYVVTEPGFNLVVRILYTLSGKEDYLLMFGVFGAAIVAIFLKVLKDQSDSFPLAFFVFMTFGFYYRSYNTVRYYFALAIALYCLRYLVDIRRDKIFKFFVLILLAATFHKSVLVVIPMYFIARFPWRRWAVFVLAAGGMVVGLLHEKVMDIALRLYPSYRNTVYIEEVHSITENAAPIFGCVFVIALCLICYREVFDGSVDMRMYFNMNVMAVALYLSCYWMPLITRFAYYLTGSQILLLPNLICRIRDDKKKLALTAAVIVFCVLYFAYFLMEGDRVGIRILPYKSWLFYEHRWLNQTDTF
ncbi:MAG: EpsG family protein [Butyrivibrio sp.]|nr:EpsG family protein [Butyrivibrio sp.]